MSDPTFPAINPAINGFVLYEPVTLTEGEALYPESYSPDVQATVEERLSAIVFQMNKAARLMRAFRFAQMAPLIGGLTDDINGFRVSRASTQPDTSTAQYGDIWLQPDAENPGARIPRVFNGIGFVEGVYAVDAILLPIKGRLQALEAQGIDGFGELVDGLRDELRGEASSAANTFKKVEDLISALTTVVSGKAALAGPAFTGVPTAPTATVGTVSTQIATTAFVKAAVDALLDSAPGALDTLNELAAALGDDSNFAATVATALAGKQATLMAPGDVPGLTAALAGKQAALTGNIGQLVGFTADGGPAVVIPNTFKYAPWFFTPTGVAANDAPKLNALFASGGHVVLGPHTYGVTPDTLVIPANTRVTGTRASILQSSAATGTTLEITGNDVVVEGFTLDGALTTATIAGGRVTNHFGIKAIGTIGTPRKGLRFKDIATRNYGECGIYTVYTERCDSFDNFHNRIGLAGELHMSPLDIRIHRVDVDDVFPGDAPGGGAQPYERNAYGIAVSNFGGQAQPQNVEIIGCTVKNVPTWEGIDVHNGIGLIKLVANQTFACSQGVVYENHVAGFPGSRTIIEDNFVVGWSGTSITRDGLACYKVGGIIANGANVNEEAGGLWASRNKVFGMGDTRPGAQNGSAYAFRGWRGYKINDNYALNSYRAAYTLNDNGTKGMFEGEFNDNDCEGLTANAGPTTAFEFGGNVSGYARGNRATGLPGGASVRTQVVSGHEMVWQGADDEIRRVIVARRDLYVTSGGSDSNSGRGATTAQAFATIARALQIAGQIDTMGNDVVINLSAHARTTPIILPQVIGGGRIVILGGSSASNYDISASGAHAVLAERIGRFHIDGVRLITTGAFDCINARGAGVDLTFNRIAFDVCGDDHIQAWEGGRVQSIRDQTISGGGSTVDEQGTYTISGGATNRHVNAFDGGQIRLANAAVTLSGTPAFGIFAGSARLGRLSVPNMTFTGAATGLRYQAEANGMISTGGQSATYLPGNAAGTLATGGIYI